MSTLLVVGSAPCLHDDVRRALSIRPFASVMLVNGACSVLEHAEHVLAGHTEKVELFAAARRKAFPNAAPWRLHATIKESHKHDAQRVFPSVTDWWDKSYAQGATSISKGAEIGFRALGFAEVILCGAPMDGSGYATGEAIVPHDCHRIGNAEVQKHRVIDGYRRKFRDKFAPRYKGRLFSMSGFTRDVVGEPRVI